MLGAVLSRGSPPLIVLGESHLPFHSISLLALPPPFSERVLSSFQSGSFLCLAGTTGGGPEVPVLLVSSWFRPGSAAASTGTSSAKA